MNPSPSTTDDIRSEHASHESVISYEDERGALSLLVWFLGGAPKKPRVAVSREVKKEAPIFAAEAHPLIPSAHVS